jgi:hypothetical protein
MGGRMQLAKYIMLLSFIATVISGNFNSATAEEIPAEQIKPKELLTEGSGEISKNKVKEVLYYFFAKKKFIEFADEYNSNNLQESQILDKLKTKLKILHGDIKVQVEFALKVMEDERFGPHTLAKNLEFFWLSNRAKHMA